MVLKARATVELIFESAEDARTIASSLEVDDGGYITTAVRGCAVVAVAEAQDPMELLHTLDDYLACATTADRIITRSRRAP
ncbi:MAG: KEOPS complex subunit Pcc1 [Candidatus Thermoplasmatota archaeon]